MDISNLYKCIVSITVFNKGKASQNFSRVAKGEPLLVVKNNRPIATIISVEEYELLREISKVCKKIEFHEHSQENIKTLLNRLDSLDKVGEDND